MAKAAIKKRQQAFWQSRQGLAAQVGLALIFAYITASLAINSGSLIQYFVTLVLIGIAISRFIKIFRK